MKSLTKIIKKIDNYLFTPGVGMFLLPAILTPFLLISSSIIDGTVRAIDIIVAVVSIPLFWFLFCVVAYVNCGGSLRKLFKNERGRKDGKRKRT